VARPVSLLNKVFCPVKFAYTRSRVGQRPRILDIGCGNHSPRLTKAWFPDCHYVGADIQRCNNDDGDLALMDEFVPIGADGSGYDGIPNDSFDLVLMNHVVEHMTDPTRVVAEVCGKIKPGGVVWIGFPSMRSLSLPSASGTLQFCDDDSHVRVVDVKDIANVLLDHGVKVIHAGRSRNLPRFLVGLGLLPRAAASKLLTGRMSALGLWYVLGFEDHVLGQRR